MTGSSDARAPVVPALHLVTDDEVLAAPGFGELADAVLRAGGHRVALHLRAPRAAGGALYRLAARLAAVAGREGGLLLVNDRVDVALGSGAHGVQLGRRGMPLDDARRLLGPGRVLGASVHSAGEARDAVAAGADFVLAGTLYPTPSHPGRPGAGVRWLGSLRALGAPVIGIGGVTPERTPEVLRAGAAGVAVLRGVWRAADPIRALGSFLKALAEDAR